MEVEEAEATREGEESKEKKLVEEREEPEERREREESEDNRLAEMMKEEVEERGGGEENEENRLLKEAEKVEEGRGEENEGKKLAEVVKETHRLLREKYKEAGGGAEAGEGVWRQHLEGEEALQRYAKAMHSLATQHWPSENEASISRVGWVQTAVRDYYWGGGLMSAMEKEMRKLGHLRLTPDQPCIPQSPQPEGTIRVLDVGSCYNPFSVFPEFEVTAIDLCPAHESVLKADFLNLKIVTKEDEGGGETKMEEDEKREEESGGGAQVEEEEGRGGRTEKKKKEMEAEEKEGKEEKYQDTGGGRGGGLEGGKEERGGREGRKEQEKIKQQEREEEKRKEPGGGGGEEEERGVGGGGEGGRKESLITIRMEGEGEGTQKAIIRTTKGREIKGEQESLTTPPTTTIITTLRAQTFNVIIFSLLLEYLPAPSQRFEACRRAYELLTPGGLLAIVTPDSRHVGANAHVYQLWRVSLAGLGFGRIKYEKRAHFHGFLFRKGLCRAAWQSDVARFLDSAIKAASSVRAKLKSIDYSRVDREMYIPQDFEDEGSGNGVKRKREKDKMNGCKKWKKECAVEGERQEN